MINKEQAKTENQFHYQMNGTGPCKNVRRSGLTQTWKKTENAHRFRTPVKYGLHQSGAITEHNAAHFHVVAECPNAQETEDRSIQRRKKKPLWTPKRDVSHDRKQVLRKPAKKDPVISRLQELADSYENGTVAGAAIGKCPNIAETIRAAIEGRKPVIQP